jgi:hypothetical protein
MCELCSGKLQTGGKIGLLTPCPRCLTHPMTEEVKGQLLKTYGWGVANRLLAAWQDGVPMALPGSQHLLMRMLADRVGASPVVLAYHLVRALTTSPSTGAVRNAAMLLGTDRHSLKALLATIHRKAPEEVQIGRMVILALRFCRSATEEVDATVP